MNVPYTAHAAKPAPTPTGRTDAAAQRDTSCSPTGYPAEPDKVSGTPASGVRKQPVLRSMCFSFLIINRVIFLRPEMDFQPIISTVAAAVGLAKINVVRQ